MERTMGPAEEKIKIIDEVILKRELTEAEKKEMLSLKNDELIAKYKSYIEIESSKGYQNNKLVMTKEFKNLTETAVIYDKDNNSILSLSLFSNSIPHLTNSFIFSDGEPLSLIEIGDFLLDIVEITLSAFKSNSKAFL